MTTAYDKIPGWTKTVRRIRTYPALRASHDRLLEACRLALSNRQHDPPVERVMRAAIAEAKEVVG